MLRSWNLKWFRLHVYTYHGNSYTWYSHVVKNCGDLKYHIALPWLPWWCFVYPQIIEINDVEICDACLFYRVCNMFLKELTSFLAALLFAVHPIHTEAVSFNILNRFIESVWNIYDILSLLILSMSLEKKNWYCNLIKV